MHKPSGSLHATAPNHCATALPYKSLPPLPYMHTNHCHRSHTNHCHRSHTNVWSVQLMDENGDHTIDCRPPIQLTATAPIQLTAAAQSRRASER